MSVLYRKKILSGYNSLAVRRPDIAKKWSAENGQTADEVLPTSKRTYYWDCDKCGRTYAAALQDVINGEEKCPFCCDRKVLPGYNSFDVRHPELMKEWDMVANYLLANPRYVSENSTKRVWWNCQKDSSHKYPMTIAARVMFEKRGMEACIYCKGRRRKLSHFMPKPKFDNDDCN